MSLKGFIKECNDREVFKLLSIYVVTSWVLLQVVSVVWEPLGLPETSVTYFIIFLLVGFPIYTFILWKVRVRVALSQDGEDIESNNLTQSSFRKMYFLSTGLVSVFSLVSAVLIINANFLKDVQLSKTDESLILSSEDKLAVLDFENNTGNPELDIIGQMASDWLVHGITEYRQTEVITSDLVKNYSSLLGMEASILGNTSILEKYLKPSKIITGAYFLKDSLLIMNCEIKDNSNNENSYTFTPVECDKENALDCIEFLRQRLASLLIMTDEEEKIDLKLEKEPPKYEAYKKMLTARAVYAIPEKYIELLDDVIDIDSTFFEPQVWRVQHYYNVGEFKISDSLNKVIRSSIIRSGKVLTRRQNNLLNFCEALIDGKNDEIYRTLEFEYKFNTQDPSTNQTLMTLMVQFVNKPGLVEEIYNEMAIDLTEITNKTSDDYMHCIYRYYVMGLAFNELEQYDETIELLEPIINIADKDFINRTLITAYINLDRAEDLYRMLTKMELLDTKRQYINMQFFVGKQYLLLGKKQEAGFYFNNVVSSPVASKTMIADAYYYLDNFKKAEKEFTKRYNNESQSIETVTKLAISYFMNDKKDLALNMISNLENLRTDYQYGNLEYAYAQYYAATGNDTRALDYLLKSIAFGNLYLPDTYQNDIHFLKYQELPKFKHVMTFWH